MVTHTHIHTHTHDNYYNPRCAHAHRGLITLGAHGLSSPFGQHRVTSDLYSAGLTFARCAFTGGPRGIKYTVNIYNYTIIIIIIIYI